MIAEVPMKPVNKATQQQTGAAELVEGMAPTTENIRQANTAPGRASSVPRFVRCAASPERRSAEGELYGLKRKAENVKWLVVKRGT